MTFEDIYSDPDRLIREDPGAFGLAWDGKAGPVKGRKRKLQ